MSAATANVASCALFQRDCSDHAGCRTEHGQNDGKRGELHLELLAGC